MDEIAQNLIERYHQKALSPEEEREFQRRIKSDADFAKEVQWHGLALDAIRLEGEKELRRRLTLKGKVLDSIANKPSHSFPWRWSIFLVFVLGLVIWLIYTENAAKAPTISPAPSEKPVPPPPSSPKSIELTPDQPQAQTKTTSVDGKKVFAAYFEPYRDASLDPSVRGSIEEISPQEHFRQLYWEGEYAAALSAFDSLNTFAQQNPNNLFLKANALLHAKQGQAAAVLLEDIQQNGHSRFMEQVPWYLALSRLQQGEWEGAERLFQQLARDTSSPRQADAKRLLRENKSK